MFQTHCLINLFCLIVTLISKVVFQVEFGIFSTLAWMLPMVGVLSFLVNQSKKGKKRFYLIGSLSSCISLLLVSQNIFRTAVRTRFGFWGTFYFLLTTAAIVGIIYLLLFYKSTLFFQKLSLSGYIGFWGLMVLISVVFYRSTLTWLTASNELIFLSYLLWVMSMTLTIITCVDLKNSFFKGRSGQ